MALAITLSCACGRRFRVDTRFVGKHAHCPYCGQRLDILCDHQAAPRAIPIGEELPLRDEELAVTGLSPGDEGWRYQALFDLAPDGYLVTDRAGLIQEANRAAEALFGVQRAFLCDQPLAEWLAPADRPLLPKVIDRLRRGEAIQGWEAHILPHGTAKPLICVFSIAPSRNADGKVVGLRWMFRDVSDRKRTEARINAYQDQLRSLASELLMTEERERRELAVDLHDGLGQTLALAKMKLDMLRRQPDPPTVKAMIDELEHILGEAHQTVRSLTFQISPPILHDLGFIPAIHWLIDDLRDRYGITITLEHDGQALPLNERARVILFRSVRELLINVAKHARTDQAKLIVQTNAKRLRIGVEDKGQGFDTARALEPEDGHGFGLFSIRERLDFQLEGRILIDSAPGKGTRITLEAPLSSSTDESSPGSNHQGRSSPSKGSSRSYPGAVS